MLDDETEIIDWLKNDWGFIALCVLLLLAFLAGAAYAVIWGKTLFL